jgi:hypothetical protein
MVENVKLGCRGGGGCRGCKLLLIRFLDIFSKLYPLNVLGTI